MLTNLSFRAAGLGLTAILAGGLFVAMAWLNEEKRVVGYDAERSLTAACGYGGPRFFTNRERLAVFLQKPGGRVAAEPVFRGGEIVSLRCDRLRGELVIRSERGEKHLALGVFERQPQALALTP